VRSTGDRPASVSRPALGRAARALRAVHNLIGAGELACLGHLWICAIARRRDPLLRVAVLVLLGEGAALLAAKGCPLGIFQRRAGDDVPMFELWFGRRLAPHAVPFFTTVTVAGLLLLAVRRPAPAAEAVGRR
jgi:hypothetical protein